MKRRPQLSAEEGGDAPLTHFSRRPPSGPRPAPPRPRASPSPAGANERGVGGPHAPHPQPRPRGEACRGLTPPSRRARAGETSRRLAARDCWAPSTAGGPGRRGPQRRRGPRRGKAVNSPSVRASPRSAPLRRPRRGPPGPSVRRGAAPPGAQGTGGESGPLPGGLRHLAERSRQQRRGKSGLTCHYFLRHLGSTCQRPHKALWVRKSL